MEIEKYKNAQAHILDLIDQRNSERNPYIKCKIENDVCIAFLKESEFEFAAEFCRDVFLESQNPVDLCSYSTILYNYIDNNLGFQSSYAACELAYEKETSINYCICHLIGLCTVNGSVEMLNKALFFSISKYKKVEDDGAMEWDWFEKAVEIGADSNALDAFVELYGGYSAEQ